MANLKNVIYLSNEDYETLVSTGTVTIDGETLTYDENNIYITPDKLASSTEDGLMSASDKSKLDNIETGAEVNVQSDWNQTNTSADDYIKNKPIIPSNILDGSTSGSLEQLHDGSTFSFVNPNSPLGGTTVNIGIATGTYATMLGGKGRVEGKRGFINGTQVVATGGYSHAEGNNSHAAGVNSHTEGIQTYASGSASHAEGSSTAATETGAHAEGYGTHADGVYTHTEGSTNYALGDNSHAEGGSNIIGVYSGPAPEPGPAPSPSPETAVHPEGMGSHAEGNNNTITGSYSHAEGQGNTISSNRAHAEGNGNTVSGLYAHAEGNGGVASGEGAHSEGLYGHAVGNYSHAEGAATYANGLYSHAQGQDSTANGTASFASGFHVTANRDYQIVIGTYNVGVSPNTLLEVGNGTSDGARSNAFEVYKDGRATVRHDPINNMDVVTKQYAESLMAPSLVGMGTTANITLGDGPSHNGFEIDLGTTSYDNGLYFFTYGNCMIMLPIYGIQLGTVYHVSATLVNSNGSYAVKDLRYMVYDWGSAEYGYHKTLKIWEANDYMPVGYTGYLFKVKLF